MRKRWLLPLLASLLILAIPASTRADVNNFTVTNFHADETLTDSDPQGILRVVETTDVTFTDYNHGIIRSIPNRYKGNSLRFHLNSVTSSTGAPTNISQSTDNDNINLRIGDPNRTVTGKQNYRIDYTLQNVISFNHGRPPELYWDVNGDQWSQPFEKVSITLHTPRGTLLRTPAPKCFNGGYGTSLDTCSIVVSGDTLTASVANLYPHQTLTYVAAFNDARYHPATFWDRVRDYLPYIITSAVPPLLAFVVGFVWWLRKGRDAKGKGTIVPEYSPPEGISPLKAGTIIDFKVDNRDMTATIIDLARRGYLTIVEKKQNRKLLPDSTNYTLRRGNANTSGLDSNEKALLENIFGASDEGTEVELKNLKNKFYKAAVEIRIRALQQLTTDGYFKSNPKKFALSFVIIFYVAWIGGSFIAGAFHLGGALVAGLIVASIIFIAFVRAMPARTQLGTDAKEHLLGLKMYMETAEKDRLQMLEGPNAKYAKDFGAPERTVELFEKLLPYAIVMGVENQWAEQFKDIYNQPPEWYSGNIHAFNTGYLVGSLNGSFATAVNTTFSAPSSSSSSGFGGGGFSGGGGGGGGGGGW